MFGWVKKAADTIKSVGKKVMDKAKDVAKKTVSFIAEKGDKIVEKVKDTWKVAKNVVQGVAIAAKVAAPALSIIPGVGPILSSVALATGVVASKVAVGMMTVEQVCAKYDVEGKVRKAIDIAKKMDAVFKEQDKQAEIQEEQQLLEERLEEIQSDQSELNQAYNEIEVGHEKDAIRYAMIINEYALLQSKINEVLLKDNLQDFEHLLRVRAVQKMLKSAQGSIANVKDVKELQDDDLFLLQIGNQLLEANPQLSDAEAQRLDELIRKRYTGKSLLPFVFEEMVSTWMVRYENLEVSWQRMNATQAGIKRQITELKTKMAIEELSPAEEMQLANLENDFKVSAYQLKQKEAESRSLQTYINASEGFLQILEKDYEEIEAEGREYLLDDIADVGQLIIDCAENNKSLSELSYDEFSLINDYANIFAQEAKERANELNKVEVVIEVA